jgi:hypothetical protein
LQTLTLITSSTVNLNDKQVKEKLQAFQGLKAGTPEFIPSLKSLMDDLAQHIKEQIYQLSRACSTETIAKD